jgi:hypothetical protein
MQQLGQLRSPKGLTIEAVCGLGLLFGFVGMFLFNAHSKIPMAAFSRIRAGATRSFNTTGSINNTAEAKSMMGYTASSELPRAQAQEPEGYVPPAAADISVTRPSPVAQGGGRKVRSGVVCLRGSAGESAVFVDMPCVCACNSRAQGRSAARRSDKEDMNAR